jgi:hypothetical protein
MNEQRNINSFQDGDNNFNQNSSPKDDTVSQKIIFYKTNINF